MIIKLENLTKEYKVKEKKGFWKDAFFPTYKSISAIQNISFSIKKGESVALLGPNGAGKTTTMKMLSGLLYPTSGKIEVLGYFPFDRNREFLKQIGLVMGNRSGLAWDLTPNQNFELLKKIYGIEEKTFQKRIKTLTEMLDVHDYLDKQVRKLSLGERMKMELIGAILHEPDILFLDEPTIGLDIISKQKIRIFLRDIQKNSEVTLLLTSHDMDDVEQVSDRVIIINHGTLIYDDSMKNLLSKYKNKRYLHLTLSEIRTKKEIGEYGKIIDGRDLEYTLEIVTDNLPKSVGLIMEKMPIADIDIIRVPLEEIVGGMFQ